MNAQNINTILDALAPRFGATGAYPWAILVREQRITASIWFVVCLLCTAGLAHASRLALKQCKEDQYSGWEVGVGIFAILSLASFLLAIANLTTLLNPEASVLHILIGK